MTTTDQATTRPSTPIQHTGNGSAIVTVKRCCNGCQREIGDATEAELEAAYRGQPLPDVRGRHLGARHPRTPGRRRVEQVRALVHDPTQSGSNDMTKRGLDPAPTAPHGLTTVLQAAFDSWPDRFRTKVTIGDGCWLWTAYTTPLGYGRFSRGGRTAGVAFAHRHAYQLTHPDVDLAGLDLDHLCRTPRCVRPDHLEPVTHAENVRRSSAANVAGWCRSGRHEWTADTILTEPDGTRRCRPCRDERERAYRPPLGLKESA